jgi:hypothetical protein
MTISAHDGVTDITGAIIDPARLLDQIVGLGLTVYSLTPIETNPARAVPHTSKPRTGDQP